MAEHNGRTGEALREYVYLGLLPIAVIQGGRVYAVHADQVAMPQKLTDEDGTLVMDRVATPFGEVVPGLSSVTDGQGLALMFPGQMSDAETQLSQNWHRDYDPRLGRYAQSDPIGLAGGLSTYGYAMQNPVSYVDPEGLQAILPPGKCSAPHLAWLELKKSLACRGIKKCNPGMTLEELVDQQNRRLSCMEARQRINSRCFYGGDFGHQKQVDDQWKGFQRCQQTAIDNHGRCTMPE